MIFFDSLSDLMNNSSALLRVSLMILYTLKKAKRNTALAVSPHSTAIILPKKIAKV